MTWLAVDGGEVSPEVAAELDLQHFRKLRVRVGQKPPGPRRAPPGQTVGERRRALCAQGHTPEQIAEAEGVELESVLRSIRPSRTTNR
jgi:hypothetical protein